MVGNNRGFTLVELLVASVILVVALGPLLGLFVHGRTVSEAGWDEVTAAGLARGKMEALKQRPLRALTDEEPAPFSDPFTSFSGAVDIKNVGPGLAHITVTVTKNTTGDEVCVLRARRADR